MIPRIVIINGPNLNLLGTRNPEVYGSLAFEEYLAGLRAKSPRIQLEYFQSNHEGDIIDWVQKWGFHADGIVINAGGYAHTSVAIRDAIEAVPCTVVDVHISNIYDRESFRHVDLLKDVCDENIIGHGIDGYEEAVQFVLKKINSNLK